MTIFSKLPRRSLCQSSIKNVRVNMVENGSSGLAYIDVKENCNPFELFKEWMEESKTFGKFSTAFFNLATTNKNGDVSNRTVVLRDFKDNSLIFMTNEKSKKIQQIKDNSKVSGCFFWSYVKDEKYIHRQVRVEGIAMQMSYDACSEYYNKDPLFCQIRSHICRQGEKVDWDDLKKKHDELLEEITATNKRLPMPEYQVAYKIIPTTFDFYYSWNNNIADRLEFIKDSENGWKFYRVAA